MPSASFELFEIICAELKGRDICFITNEDLGSETEDQTGGKIDNVLDNLRIEHNVADNQRAIAAALKLLESHFQSRRSELPFSYDLSTRQFRTRDPDFVGFITDVSERRSYGKKYAKEVENATCRRLAKKVTGVLHNVGDPRAKLKALAKYRTYLRGLGFDGNVVLGKERDGGLDILWFPPFGAIPLAPLVSLQCKNGRFNRKVAREAANRTGETLQCHGRFRGEGVYLSAVVFNDYIEPELFPDKPIKYIPLGLSDLAPVKDTEIVEI